MRDGYLRDVDIIQLLDSRLDLMLVCLDVTDEDEGVVILDLLHGRLGGERVLDDVVGVHLVPARCGLPGVLGSTGRAEGLGAVELDAGADLGHDRAENMQGGDQQSYLLHPGAVHTLHNLLLHFPGLLHSSYGSLGRLGLGLTVCSPRLAGGGMDPPPAPSTN